MWHSKKANDIYFYLSKALLFFALAVFFYRATLSVYSSPSVTLVLMLVGEVVTLCIVLLSRKPKCISFSFISLISAFVGTFYFFVVFLGGGEKLVPFWFSAFLQCAGIVLQIYAKIHLGRSFGVLAANRGIVTSGPFRVVRHPIYLGYLVSHIGFLLGNFSFHNLWLYSALYFFQGLRIREEEVVLRKDPEYVSYMKGTKYRVIPGII